MLLPEQCESFSLLMRASKRRRQHLTWWMYRHGWSKERNALRRYVAGCGQNEPLLTGHDLTHEADLLMECLPEVCCTAYYIITQTCLVIQGDRPDATAIDPTFRILGTNSPTVAAVVFLRVVSQIQKSMPTCKIPARLLNGFTPAVYRHHRKTVSRLSYPWE